MTRVLGCPNVLTRNHRPKRESGPAGSTWSIARPRAGASTIADQAVTEESAMRVVGSGLVLDVLDVVCPEREWAKGATWRDLVHAHLYHLASRNEHIRYDAAVLQEGNHAADIHRMFRKRLRLGCEILGKSKMSQLGWPLFSRAHCFRSLRYFWNQSSNH